MFLELGDKKVKKYGGEVFWIITPSFCVAMQSKREELFFFFFLSLFVLAGFIACPWKAYSAHSTDRGLQGGNREEIVQKAKKKKSLSLSCSLIF